MKLHLTSILLATSLTACTSSLNPPPVPEKTESPMLFGPWAALPQSCQIRGRTEDFTLSTTGHVENGTLALYLTFKPKQGASPKLTITGLAIPLAPEGRSPTYGYTLPFTPDIAARLTDPTSHFQVLYYSKGAPQAYEASLPTAGFMQALASLAINCP